MAERMFKFVWEEQLQGAKQLTVTARWIGQVLATKDNGTDKAPFMSNTEIVERTGLSEKTVRNARKALEEAGWITVVRRGGRSGNGSTWATSYRLTIPPRPSLGWGAAAELDGARSPVPSAERSPDGHRVGLGWSESQPVTTEPQPVADAGSTGNW